MTKYQRTLVITLTIMLFTIVVDYMLLPALSAFLLEDLSISTDTFGFIASAYGLSAGISSFLSIGFIDRFDRRKFLLVVYTGFVLGLLSCTLAASFEMLLIARILTGLSGGMVGSACLTIVADAFQADNRGKVMGFIQMAYAGGQIGGLPLTMFLASEYNWHISYGLIASLGILSWILAVTNLRSMSDHINANRERKPWRHAIQTIGKGKYWHVFVNNVLIAMGDMMLMTFNSLYLVQNLGLTVQQLPIVFMTIGAVGFASAPLWGKLADQLGKVRVFSIGTGLSIGAVVLYTQVEFTEFWTILMIHGVLFAGVNARMVASTSLGMGLPATSDRGAFMSLDASLQQVTAGLGAVLAGLVVVQSEAGPLDNFNLIGWIVPGLMLMTILLIRRIDWLISEANKDR